MVNEYSGSFVPFSSEPPFELGDKSGLSGFHLIDGHTFARVSGYMYLVVCLGPCTPWHLGHFSKKAASTSWFLDLFKPLGYLTIPCQDLER